MDGVAVTRTETPTGWWELARRAPSTPLSDVIAGFCGYRERSRTMFERTMPAGSKVPVIISFGDALEIDNADGTVARHESFVAGLHPGPSTTRYEGGQFGVQVDLTPLGAYQVFGIPGAELAHQIVPLADTVSWLSESFADRLASQRTWLERFALVEELLLAKRNAGPAPDPMVSWLWRELETTNGRASISDLVGQTGRSHRHVTTRFRDQIGLTPKAAASLLRFENAAHTIARRRMPLADAAVAVGYADQSHLTYEFAKHTGRTPAAWLATMDGAVAVDFVQD